MRFIHNRNTNIGGGYCSYPNIKLKYIRHLIKNIIKVISDIFINNWKNIMSKNCDDYNSDDYKGEDIKRQIKFVKEENTPETAPSTSKSKRRRYQLWRSTTEDQRYQSTAADQTGENPTIKITGHN